MDDRRASPPQHQRNRAVSYRHSSNQNRKKWNHSVDLNTERFFEHSIWSRADLIRHLRQAVHGLGLVQNAHDLTVWLLNLDADYVDCAEVAGSLGWSAWHFNPDIAYLVSAWIVSSHEYMGGRKF